MEVSAGIYSQHAEHAFGALNNQMARLLKRNVHTTNKSIAQTTIAEVQQYPSSFPSNPLIVFRIINNEIEKRSRPVQYYLYSTSSEGILSKTLSQHCEENSLLVRSTRTFVWPSGSSLDACNRATGPKTKRDDQSLSLVPFSLPATQFGIKPS